MAVGVARQNGARAARNAALIALLGATAAACASTGTGLSMSSPAGRRYAQAAPSTQQSPSSSGRLRGTDKPYQVNGKWYFPHSDPTYDVVGTASWYGYPFQNRHTADGEVYDEALITAAHKTLPLPCIVEVTNLQNGRSIRVRVNDRGPFVGERLIDLSKAAAEQLGFDRRGTTQVRVRFITMATPLTAPGLMMASSTPPPRYSHSPAYQAAPPPARDDDGSGDIEAAPPPAYSPTPTAVPTAYRPAPVGDAQPTDDEAGPPESAPPPTAAPITSAPLPPPVYSQDPGQSAASYAPPRAYAAAGGGFAVQAGAFATRSAADRAVARLSSAGGVQIVPLERNGAVLYKVVVGSFPDAATAGETRARVIAMGFADARVVGAL